MTTVQAQPRQLIVCCDGTNNNLTGGCNDTNVTKLSDLLDPEGQDQLLYYDPGVGNPGELPGASLSDTIGRRFERIYGLAFGKGVYENIAEAYLFLMRHYREGDQIYIYGFSRGAFTARSIGGLVTQFGILRPEMEGLVHTLLHIYFSDREKGAGEYTRIRAQINEMFCAPHTRQAPVWFVGVWDTVASVGAPLLSRTITGSPTIVGKRFHHVRQALALDEHRRVFKPRPYHVDPAHDYAAHGQSIRQLWFSGAHCDVGGGYSHPESHLSNEALVWMLQESLACGLRLPAHLLDAQGQVDAMAVAASLRRPREQPLPGGPVVHSETWNTPLWAVAGLQQRNTQEVEDSDGTALPATPQEHPTVAQHKLAYPADTVWSRRRPWSRLVLAVAAVAFFWAWAGGLLAGQLGTDQSLWQNLAALLAGVGAKAQANLALAQWQLEWVTQCSWQTLRTCAIDTLPADPERIRSALWADLGLIAGYVWLLAIAVTWAFARVAGLRRAQHRPSRLLDLLGMALPLAMWGDLLENGFTWFLVGVSPTPFVPGGALVLGVGMTLGALAKWLGLAGCACLLAWALLPRGRVPAAAEAQQQPAG